MLYYIEGGEEKTIPPGFFSGMRTRTQNTRSFPEKKHCEWQKNYFTSKQFLIKTSLRFFATIFEKNQYLEGLA